MLLSHVNFSDIQGLIRFGHGHLDESRLHLLTVKNVAAAKKWLAGAGISSALKESPPDTALQVAFSYDGLKTLGLPRRVLEQFSHEFRTGMYEENRARRLGDVDANSPGKWHWGQSGNSPHLLIMTFARTGQLAAFEKQIKGSGWSRAFSPLIKPLDTGELTGKEHFGFLDGTSQPKIDWEQEKSLRRAKTAGYSNLSALGEFLLGYPNEYGKYTQRPLLDAKELPPGTLPLAEDIPGKLDLGRNGTYLVFRDLEQNVAAFEDFILDQTGSDKDQYRALKRAMVGRHPDGLPIIPDGLDIVPNDNPGQTIPEGAPVARLQNLPMEGVGPKMQDVWLNQFTFAHDMAGTVCPHGAHIRRANPRTGDLPAGRRNWVSRAMRMLGFDLKDPHHDLVAATRFHRIVRRGRIFGPVAGSESRSRRKGKPAKRGLRFICLNANISRQFEFIQSSWLENPKFDGLDNSDPLLGSRASLWSGGATDNYVIPQDNGAARKLTGLQQFVTVNGGGYFFMPGLRALRYIAGR